ncbi:hypothetical protein BJ508DRAFT_363118 [Ascobolus immersus RN42]|uniref:Uncharacterized protein n=1 Tax=Ascobolus immersus RN42 TaxID=1160509 RepID=A0A3N4I5V3_ASCIM|nr:hypothetical protein BJ508DRAFT_363118 [Ascobolus immersus RN42]
MVDGARTQPYHMRPSQRTHQCPMVDGARIAPVLLQPFTFDGQLYSIPADLVEWTGNAEDLKNPKLNLESLNLDEFEQYLSNALGTAEEPLEDEYGQNYETDQLGEQQLQGNKIPFEVMQQVGKKLQQQGLLPEVHPNMSMDEKNIYLHLLAESISRHPHHATTQEPGAQPQQALSDPRYTDNAYDSMAQTQVQGQVHPVQIHGSNKKFQMSDELRAFGMQLAQQGLPQHEIRQILLAICYKSRTRACAQLQAYAQGQQVQIPPAIIRDITALTEEQQVPILESYWQQVALQKLQGKSLQQIQQMVFAGQKQRTDSTMLQMPSPQVPLQQYPRNVSLPPAPQHITQPVPQAPSLINGQLLETTPEQFREELEMKMLEGLITQQEAQARFHSFITGQIQPSQTATFSSQTSYGSTAYQKTS